MATNFRVKMGEIGRLTFIRRFGILNGVEYRNSDFKTFIGDMTTLLKNLVNFGPVTPEFKGAKMYTPRRSAVWLRSLSGATARPCRDQY